jgi:hypothetical protein
VGEGGACKVSDEQGHSDESGSESGEGGREPGAQVNTSGVEVEVRLYCTARGRYGLKSAESTLGAALDEVEAELGRESRCRCTMSTAACFLSLLSIRRTWEELAAACRFCTDFFRCRVGWLVDVRRESASSGAGASYIDTYLFVINIGYLLQRLVGTLLCKVGGCVHAAFLQKILFLNTPGLIVSKDTPWWDYRAV